MQLSLGEIASILETQCAAPNQMARGFSLDSRTIAAGELFFAVRGRRLDGHQFVASALERGAVGAVVEHAFFRQTPRESSARLIPVADTTQALHQLARALRRRWGGQVVAVTGSTGKTTTKELIAALLAPRLAVHKSSGNLNNEFGLPQVLLALEARHQVAVVELAMSAAGEISRLARIAEPEIGVFTNVAPVHLQFFQSVEAIAQAKRELIENLRPPGIAVLNYDDPYVRQFSEGFAGRVVTYGFQEGADFRAVEPRTDACGGTRVRLTGPGLDGLFHIPLPGRHNVENVLAAVATVSIFGLSPEEVKTALATFRNLHQRGEILTLSSNITLINDSYNSNPRAMERMLDTLAAWPDARRRIVIAGEMLELGPSSPEWHREIGHKCAQIGIDWLLAVQGDARFFLEGAMACGFPPGHGRFFAEPEPAAEFCAKLLQPGDVILIKGSRGVHLEKATELLQRVTERSSSAPGAEVD